MRISEIREQIVKETGLAPELLKGETPEEIIVEAKAILALTRDERLRSGSPRDQFTNYANKIFSTEESDPLMKKLVKIEENYKEQASLNATERFLMDISGRGIS